MLHSKEMNKMHPIERIHQAFEQHPALHSVQITLKALYEGDGEFDSLHVDGVSSNGSYFFPDYQAFPMLKQVKTDAEAADIELLMEDSRFEREDDEDGGYVFLVVKRNEGAGGEN